ncbi:MAG TPA: IS630 family transposase, partial [Terriglobales bacterium]|nr:IS630 family transposase [Terriglobales bacterium]
SALQTDHTATVLPQVNPENCNLHGLAPSSTRSRAVYAAGERGGPSHKSFATRLAQIAAAHAAGKPIGIWFADEARIGQKNKATRRWARRGTRPSAPSDQRTGSTHIFGAICPARGIGAGLVLPFCNSTTLSLRLAEISQAVSDGAHAVVLLDQAGWHTSSELAVPANISLLPLPPKSPELNPTENIWQYLRDNWLSNRVFDSAANIVDHCCHAWNKLIDQPWTITSIGLREWAHA